MKYKILVIDGQGGKIGKLLIENMKSLDFDLEITAIGTNSIATANMLRAGADFGATGENPVIVNSRGANVIIGPIGIVIADSLMGEVTPNMAISIGQSGAHKILLPINRCDNYVVGVKELPISELISKSIEALKSFLTSI